MVVRFLPVAAIHEASLRPSSMVMRASTRMASRSPAIRVAVDAGQVAVLAESHPGPPLTGTYPLLKTRSASDTRVGFRSMGQSVAHTTRHPTLLAILCLYPWAR